MQIEDKNKDELTQIEQIIDKAYTSDILKKIYNRYLKHLFENVLATQKKAEIVYMLAMVYADKNLFQKLYASFSEDVKMVLPILVWEGGKHDIRTLEKMFKVKILEEEKWHNTARLKDNYILFQAQIDNYYSSSFDRGKYYLYLTDNLRKIIKRYLPLPEEYNLFSLKTIEKTGFIYEDNDQILRQINLFTAYINQGNLRFSKNQNKVLKISIKEMARCCNIKEFYADKELENIKTLLISDFLIAANIKEIGDPLKILKQLFDGFFNYNGLKEYLLRNLLSHIKGEAYDYYHHGEFEEIVRRSFCDLLKAMSDYQWYLVENAIQYCLYRDLSMDIVNRKVAERYLYYYKKDKYYDERITIADALYKDAIIVPLVKAAMFLFSSFGLVDIAYNLPENPILQEKEHKYLSVFDGLKYVRLTKLGTYILGLIKEYEAVEIKEQKATLALDEKRLLIHMKGEDILKRLTLEKIGERVGKNHYRVDYNSFLKECSCEKDIHKKVMLFKEHISPNPPHIWQDFLDSVLKKINPLTMEEEMRVYKLTPDKELISLLATDEVLKKYIFKAEDYRILVEDINVNRVKKRLGELGYFVDRI